MRDQVYHGNQEYLGDTRTILEIPGVLGTIWIQGIARIYQGYLGGTRYTRDTMDTRDI